MAHNKLFALYDSKMDHLRWPDAATPEFVGVGTIHDWTLRFRGKNRVLATIERKVGGRVPCLVFALGNQKEYDAVGRMSDPDQFRMETIQVSICGKFVSATTYVMNEMDRPYGVPAILYKNLLQRAYERYGLDVKVLEAAISEARQICKTGVPPKEAAVSDDTIFFAPIKVPTDTQAQKDYFACKADDLLICGQPLWALSDCGSLHKITRGVAFLEAFHRLRIDSACVAAVLEAEEIVACITRPSTEQWVLRHLHEICKMFARQSNTLRRYREKEAELTELIERGWILAEARLETAIAELPEVQQRCEACKTALLELEALLPLPLPPEFVRDALASASEG